MIKSKNFSDVIGLILKVNKREYLLSEINI